MKWSVGTKIGAGFGLAMIIFLIVGAVAYDSATDLIEASNARRNTFKMLAELSEVELLLKDVETGARGFILTGDEAFLRPYRAAEGKVAPALGDVRALTTGNAEQQRRLDVLEPLIERRVAFDRETVAVRRKSGADAAIALMRSGEGQRLQAEIRKTVGEIVADENALLETRVGRAEAGAATAKSVIIFGTLAALVLAALAGLIITRNVAYPLRELTAVAERITVGDLSVNVRVLERGDEVGTLSRTFGRMTHFLREMAHVATRIAGGDLRGAVTPQSAEDALGNAFARMGENLREQIGALVEGASVLGSAASEIVASTAQLASSATESAAAVSETTTTVEEVRQTAQMSSQKAKFVSESAQKAAQVSQGGRASTQEAVAGMARIRQQMDAIAASMVRLSEQGQAIAQIMATVEDLAVQSNLLAVNASIEAAKAGEHGKGFGVVAQEVKSLAEQSRQATNQVRAILGDVQKATAAAVMATEQGGKAVEAGSRQTEAAGASIQALAGSVSEAAQAATQIAASSQQQLVGVDQVAGAMESIKQASSQNVASAQQLETAARGLNELGQRIKQMVERYQV